MKPETPLLIAARGPPLKRLTAFLIAIIGLNLAACCCTGFTPPAKTQAKPNEAPPPGIEAPQIAGNQPQAEPKPRQEDLKAPLIKNAEPRKRFEPNVTAADINIWLPKERDFKTIHTAEINKIKVELLSGEIKKVEFMRHTSSGLKKLSTPADHLIVKVKVTNGQYASFAKYDPWHALPAKTPRTKAPLLGDEFRGYQDAWFSGTASWPVGGMEKGKKLGIDESVVDIVAFEAPSWYAEELDIHLPASNVGQQGFFKLKIARAFFEDEALRKSQIDEKIKAAIAVEVARQRKIEDKRLADEAAAVQAKLDADLREKDRQVQAKRKAADDAARAASRGASRANYNKVTIGMTYREVEDILGPGKEAARGTGIGVATWQSTPGLFEQLTIISITFENNRVAAKAIIGP